MGNTGPKRFDDTRCKTYKRRITRNATQRGGGGDDDGRERTESDGCRYPPPDTVSPHPLDSNQFSHLSESNPLHAIKSFTCIFYWFMTFLQPLATPLRPPIQGVVVSLETLNPAPQPPNHAPPSSISIRTLLPKPCIPTPTPHSFDGWCYPPPDTVSLYSPSSTQFIHIRILKYAR